MRRAVLLLLSMLALAACGSDEPAERPPAPAVATETQEKAPAAKRPRGTEVVVAGSEFGPMLYGADRQAIYIFENDPKGRTACEGECAAAWPPVYTKGKPRAGKGVRQSFLGTVRRPDGRRQVSYSGKPLYFYAHEKPGEVRCHNVDLNGGLWWVVGPDGKRRP